MPTTKPVLGYRPSYWIPPFALKAKDEAELCKLANISDEKKQYFRDEIEDSIAVFKAEATDLERSPTQSQIRAALRRVAKDCRNMYEFLSRPGSRGMSNQLDGTSRQFIKIS